ncbi:MAG TPA: hypothetical protein VE999_13195 [Gemmataceae bacterium]|nr:hypothetical protein [Gemmataceae bacterium]
MAQVIVTWAQHSAPRQLETFIASRADKQIEDFVRRLSGLSAALCADQITGVKPGILVTEEVRGAALVRLDQLQGPQPKQAYRGSSAEIVCADHLGRDAPYLLYQASPAGGAALRPRENFRALAGWLLRKTIPQQYHPMLDPSATEAIGAMLYEIFKNTADHALVDAQGDILNISIRALKTTHLGLTPADLLHMVEEFEPLARYCQTLRPPQGATQVHLFELSVLDSGPGFATTWTGRSLDLLSEDEEELAVRECFGRGSAKGQDRFGEGLPHVIRVLRRQQGFLRLRTGRLSFFADFSSAGRAVEGSQVLQRWRNADLSPLAPVAGKRPPIGENVGD